MVQVWAKVPWRERGREGGSEELGKSPMEGRGGERGREVWAKSQGGGEEGGRRDGFQKECGYLGILT
jgi:hypothetical protein